MQLIFEHTENIILTIYLQMILNRRLAAGHSGQKRTTRRSDTRLSNIARYSASFEFFVALALPDLWVRNKTIAFAAFVADSRPDI
jgi:hypothetical protein